MLKIIIATNKVKHIMYSKHKHPLSWGVRITAAVPLLTVLYIAFAKMQLFLIKYKKISQNCKNSVDLLKLVCCHYLSHKCNKLISYKPRRKAVNE